MTIRTNTNAYKAKVFAHIAASTYDFEGDEKATAQHIFDMFESYDYPANRKRIPNRQARIADWLAGMPLNIGCYNGEIVALAEEWAETTYTPKQAEKIVENWFNFMAFKLMQFWEKHEVAQ